MVGLKPGPEGSEHLGCAVQDATDSLRRVGKAMGPSGSMYKTCKVNHRAQPSQTINKKTKKKKSPSVPLKH